MYDKLELMNANRIRSLRERLQLSQEALARQIGVSAKTIWRAEQGKRLNPVIESVIEEKLRQLEESQ